MINGLSAQKLEESVNSSWKRAMWSAVGSLSFCRMKFFFLLREIHFSVDLLKVDLARLHETRLTQAVLQAPLKSEVKELPVSPLEWKP